MIPGNLNADTKLGNISRQLQNTLSTLSTSVISVSSKGFTEGFSNNFSYNNDGWISNATLEEDNTNDDLPTGVSVILILLYVLTSLIAILGNVVAVIVFTKGKRSKTDLRPFLINLSIADLIMAMFCIPFTFTDALLNEWVFSRPMCPIVLFLQTVSVTASASTNMVIGIDRFYAVAYPLKSRVTSSKYRIVITVIWIIAISLNGVQLHVGQTELKFNTSSSLTCGEAWESESARQTYTMFILILTYIVPLNILTITYSIVGCMLWRRQSPGNADAIRDQQQLKSKRKVVKMAVTIVLFFGLCWLPLHIFNMVLDFKPSLKADPSHHRTLRYIFFFAHWTAMSNSFVNPIIFGTMNDSFRADVRTLVFRMWPWGGKVSRSRHTAVKWKTRSAFRDDELADRIEMDRYLRKGLLQNSLEESLLETNGHLCSKPQRSSAGKTLSSKSY